MEDRLNRLEGTVYGNGKDGLTVRVGKLEDARLAAKERWALYCAAAFSLASFLPKVIDWIARHI